MEDKIKEMSMFEATKMAREVRQDFEEKIIKDILESIDNKVAEKLKEKYFNPSQEKENYLDLPMRVCMLYGVMHLHGVGEEDEVLYTLHVATDVNTGKLSIQYQGDDGTFLSHKKVIKAIKKENNL